MLDDLGPDARALADYMSALSEATYFAGWMSGLEFDLWALTLGAPSRYSLTGDESLVLTGLSQRCGGWIVFDPVSEETWIPLDVWKRRYALVGPA